MLQPASFGCMEIAKEHINPELPKTALNEEIRFPPGRVRGSPPGRSEGLSSHIFPYTTLDDLWPNVCRASLFYNLFIEVCKSSFDHKDFST